MSKRIRGIISFLLVFVLCFGMIPNVSAAEIGATESIIETEATEATTTEKTAPPRRNITNGNLCGNDTAYRRIRTPNHRSYYSGDRAGKGSSC